VIHIHDVSKKFGSVTVLQNIELHLATGRTHVILGSSGSGKSTLLRIIMGLLSSDSGEIKINAQMGPGPLASKIGYVVQEGVLFPHMTIKHRKQTSRTV
jgi:ABC-type sugar transport system ATPase subunit